jgi:hypothetical protein
MPLIGMPLRMSEVGTYAIGREQIGQCKTRHDTLKRTFDLR